MKNNKKTSKKFTFAEFLQIIVILITLIDAVLSVILKLI